MISQKRTGAPTSNAAVRVRAPGDGVGQYRHESCLPSLVASHMIWKPKTSGIQRWKSMPERELLEQKLANCLALHVRLLAQWGRSFGYISAMYLL
jgi:hypothetical protein